MVDIILNDDFSELPLWQRRALAPRIAELQLRCREQNQGQDDSMYMNIM